MVRPLALLGPVLVLVICLPLLRPLRHPADISIDEQLRIATVRALVERGTLALDNVQPGQIDGTVLRDGHPYSAQPPMMALLLSIPLSASFSVRGAALARLAGEALLLGTTLVLARRLTSAEGTEPR